MAAHEAEHRLKAAKVLSRQQQEQQALLQRGARGRDELELRRCSEAERRSMRFRNIVAVSGAHADPEPWGGATYILYPVEAHKT